ncbi:MAG: iron ABC transporter permease, partial [Alphaproteobacteria bacterium]|nr:iron ABC transporter permease [Alphaproteobacteria bacterium]
MSVGASSLAPRLRELLGFWPLVTLGAFAAVTLLLVLPVVGIVGMSFAGKTDDAGLVDNYLTFFGERFYYQTLINSFVVASLATLGAVLVGVPAAYFVTRYDVWGRSFVRAAVVLTFVSPPFIGSYSWVILFGRSGLISGWVAQLGIELPSIYGAQGIVFVFVLQFFPFVFLLVSSGLRSIDQSIEDAARNLGSSEFRSFVTVIAPLLIPSITTGALLVFVASFSEFGTPIILGERFRVLPVLVYSEFVNEFGGRPAFAATLSVLLLAVTATALVVQRAVAARHAHGAQTIRPLEMLEQPLLKRVLASAFVLALTGLALLPILNIVISSFLKANGPILLAEATLDNYRHVGRTLWTPLSNTLLFTTAATLLCAVVGTAVGYIVVRRRSALTGLLDMVIMFSYAVPGIVLGVGLVVVFNEPPLILTGTATILVLAYFVRRLPFSVRSSVAMLQQISRDAEDASVNLGAGPARTFVLVTVP